MSILKDSVNIYMQEDPVYVDVASTVAEVASLMKVEEVGTIVVTDNYKIIGIVTDRDIVTKVVARSMDPEFIAVSDIMTINPETVDQYVTSEQALKKMANYGLRRLPVVNEQDDLVGMISLSDLSSFIQGNVEYMNDILSIISTDVRYSRT